MKEFKNFVSEVKKNGIKKDVRMKVFDDEWDYNVYIDRYNEDGEKFLIRVDSQAKYANDNEIADILLENESVFLNLKELLELLYKIEKCFGSKNVFIVEGD